MTKAKHRFEEETGTGALILSIDNGAGKLLPLLDRDGTPFNLRHEVARMRSQAEANRFIERVLKGCGVAFSIPRPEPQAGDRPGDLFKRSQAAWDRTRAEREYSKW